MKSLSFRKDLIGVQDELLRFAYKLTTDREEANDLLQETSLKALDNEDKYTPDTNFRLAFLLWECSALSGRIKPFRGLFPLQVLGG